MPLQNRVTPTGEIIRHPARGTMMGNRGILHDDHRELGKRRWAHKAWIACRLDFNGRRRQVMAPRRYTELFFLDEAVAFAAGHRPCFECRRGDFHRFMDAWAAGNGLDGAPGAAALDRALHAARLAGRAQRRHAADIGGLPDGVFVLLEDGAPALVLRDALLPFDPGGYGPPRERPKRARATVLTPEPVIAAFRAGYRPALHPSVAA